MLDTLTHAEFGQIETALIEAAKGALPPTKEEWTRLDELRARKRYELTIGERGELSALSARAERLLLTPQEISAEETLFAKYGPTTGTAIPRRATTIRQSIVEKALAAAFYGFGRGVEQPFSERAERTVDIEEDERPTGRGVFEQNQYLGGGGTVGSGDGFKRVREAQAPDGLLEPLDDIFPGYLGQAMWVFWDAIREFDADKRKPNNPNPLGAVIWLVANKRIRHALSALPHGLARYGSRAIRDERSARERQIEVMETAFAEAMIKADAAVEKFLKLAHNNTDADVLRLWWPLPSEGSPSKAIRASEIARRLDVDRSVISRRIKRIRRKIGDLDHALVIWETINSYSLGQITESELATNKNLAGIINRGDIVPPLVRLERRSTGVFAGPPYDPLHQCKRKVRLKNGKYVIWTCQQTVLIESPPLSPEGETLSCAPNVTIERQLTER
jgi:hypothetical protein